MPFPSVCIFLSVRLFIHSFWHISYIKRFQKPIDGYKIYTIEQFEESIHKLPKRNIIHSFQKSFLHDRTIAKITVLTAKTY